MPAGDAVASLLVPDVSHGHSMPEAADTARRTPHGYDGFRGRRVVALVSLLPDPGTQGLS